jgi:hypothetical protein
VQRSVKLAALAARGQHDALDKAAQSGGRRVTVLRMIQGVGKPRDLAAVDVRDIGMDVGDVDGRRLRWVVGPNRPCPPALPLPDQD